MKNILFLLFLSCFSLFTSVHGAPPKQVISPSKKLPKLLEEVEKKYTRAATLSADFIQLNEDAVLSHKKKSSGRIYLKRPSRVRWETTQPDSSQLLSDGRRFWFYTPPFEEGERGQVIEQKASQVQSKLAGALLAGSFSVARDMKIVQKTPSTFLLTPKPGTAGTVLRATIEIDPDKQLIQKVILDHKGGNHSEISLSRIELGKPLGDDLFTFVTPPNTDVVDTQK